MEAVHEANMENLSKRHVVFLYLLESLFFTRWPYVATESLVSLTNLMTPVSLFGIACLLYSYVRLCTHGYHGKQLGWWQHTSTYRKIAALSYWSSPRFVGLLIVGSGLASIVQGKIYPGTYDVMHAVACRALRNIIYVTENMFTGYVMLAALIHDAALSVGLYVMYYIFLRKYSEIRYIISNFFFLIVFITLF
jgi:hypothetical protein